jgi:hypothetical protein
MEPWAHFGNISMRVNVTVTFPDGGEVSRQVEGDTVRISHPEK